MFYNQSGKIFLFQKDSDFLIFLKSHLVNGVIKEYPDVFCLEPLPEILHKSDYDFIIIDGSEVSWENLILYTKDRLKASIHQLKSGENDSIKIENFYNRRYDPGKISSLFENYKDMDAIYSDFTFTERILGFSMIKLRAN